MGVELFRIEQLLSSAFPDGKVYVRPLAADGEHYAIRVVSSAFVGKSKLEQHRMVYGALSGTNVHALQIQTEVGKQDEQ